MQNRKNPCNINQRRWGDMLSEPVYIPLNQRSYKWDTCQLKNFMDDMFSMFEENKYNYLMGTVIIYKDIDGHDYIYDGQQRLISIAILLYILCGFCDTDHKYFMRINLNNPIGLTDLHKELLEIENVESIPKIYCINKEDMAALIHSFNNKYIVTKKFIKNTCDFNYCEDYFISNSKYECICGATYKMRSGFIKHLRLKHKYINDKDKSQIYTAHDYIYTYIIHKYDIENDKSKILNFINFIWNDTQINYCKCDDPEYVSRLFEWNNNRGKTLKILDIIKNRIIIRIKPINREIFYEQWELWKNKKSAFNKNYAEILFMCGIDIYLKKFDKNNLESKFSILLKKVSGDIHLEMNKLFRIMKDVENLYNKLMKHKFGILFTICPKVFTLNLDIFRYIIVPYYFYDNKKSDLIENIIQFSIRLSCVEKLPKFNVFLHLENHITNLINNNKYNFYEKIKKYIIKYIDTNIDKTYFDKNFAVSNLRMVKVIFMFIEIKRQNKGFIIPDNYSLEHIIPQKNNKNISTKVINNIGNLTLLESENSENGHKGNSSLHNINYNLKITSYSNSYFKITNELSEKYLTFDESSVVKRSVNIKKEINIYTFID